jgi:hypothetical protein
MIVRWDDLSPQEQAQLADAETLRQQLAAAETRIVELLDRAELAEISLASANAKIQRLEERLGIYGTTPQRSRNHD